VRSDLIFFVAKGVNEMWATAVTKHIDKKNKASIPLEKHVANMRQYFVQQRNEVPQLRLRRDSLIARKECTNRRFEHRVAADLGLEIEQLNDEIDARVNLTREHEYEQMIAPYTAAYNQRVEIDDTDKEAPRNITAPGCGKKRETIDTYVQQYDATATRQTTLLNEYLMETNHEPPKLALNTRDECPLCHASLVLVSSKAIMTCKACGYCIAYLDATMQSMSYSDDVEFSSFSYKRINHFNEWLQQVQAKENFEIPQGMIDAVMNELYRQRITDTRDITPKRVREVLKKLKLRKAYEHVAQITCRLTGSKPLRVPPEAEEMCRLMFIAVQPAFEKHCPKDRKNFLSYSYCLFKFFQLLGYDEFLDSFTLLKGRDKLLRQDEIFKKICEELDWEFINSV
tara:strand:+ start:882 stop:2075 length:1194 start_codon:yes stop_codon:yes gene_type:complete